MIKQILIIILFASLCQADGLIIGGDIGGDPATGTLLVGDNTAHSARNADVSLSQVPCWTFTATISGTAHTCKYDQAAWDATTSKCLVYSAGDALLSNSDAQTPTTGIQTYTLSTPVTIVSGTAYKICPFGDDYLLLGTSGTGGTMPVFGAAVWPTPDNTFTPTGAGERTAFEGWLEQ